MTDIKDLIGEATEYDKKQQLEVKKPKSRCKSVSAFANTLGGSLIFGISDSVEALGLDDAEGDAERISETIKSRMDPAPEFKLQFHNEKGKMLIVLDVFNGSIISLIENGENFIKRNSKMMWRKTANSREEMPEYVERSYHEALVNGLGHRDYLIYGSEVHIDIYDDRMEIYSPGGMPDGSIIQERDPLTVP